MRTSRRILPAITNTLRHHRTQHKNFSRPLSNMSIWYPRYASTTHPTFSSLFRMLDDFEKYASSSLSSPMSNPFGGLATLGSSGSPSSTEIIAPKFDVTEHESDYSLQGELPGVPPENVTIEFTDPQTLVIHGHAEREHTEGDPSLKSIGSGEESKKIEGGKKESKKSSSSEGMKEGESGSKPMSKYWLSERSFGEFSRVFNFPSSVDQDKVEAKFNHGLLNVMVPKASKKGARKIEIK
ncbi:putative heat shock protein [Podospora aff. communis PSN243]|uniref:Heat shock protein n=1 Tax=Podospora aff. communis PSN243 TaxID=3040156 RepID=A0AAV9GQI3_9PEZI|nr:putative heat shock protein [Podospora aff. communis PSN243]